ncbi:indole-3-glycerol phosphate synthase [Halobacillus karajensis]|uniref:Indole-3-glycerol phosphate synthase n=1 Tax=Halobacillus karajensis TaxID=195088 RepID=A0A024P5H2_9BACI|nr:indole-3-glycerol phosphate synthase TrpC [Halobacillus karajensis]CDQ20416.1 Indole-3-glycerol phosphate synthase [Halobacillus karajensis]CDQ24115.1 Indole-3-glycerol phosphate synthase [Halobacillus karajensis]CDQ27593.1 Indole-3-glycerol phosphate synthase [Halobacillus karajensis]SEH91991.1 indole-3-glycerol phosphate synthase [Halobacillus karajensis]
MLETILAVKQQEIEKLFLPEEQSFNHYSLYNSLKKAPHAAGLIAEVKKASPSKGIIREDFNPVQIAYDYDKAGVQAISVLTDQHFFQGHRDYLTAIKKVVDVPVLRKDFIIDSIQVAESAYIGADAILLIGEAMEAKKLHELYCQAYELGMEALVEVHSEDTLNHILNEFTPKILGINNRNLHTFETTLSQTEQMAKRAPKECILVSESGIFTYEDLQKAAAYGAEGVLVGESLMRQKDIKAAVRKLLEGVNVG